MKETQKKFKEFFATSWAIDNRTSIYVLTIIITMLGVLSYISIPKEQFPEIIIPTIIVNTPYPGTSPEDMENHVLGRGPWIRCVYNNGRDDNLGKLFFRNADIRKHAQHRDDDGEDINACTVIDSPTGCKEFLELLLCFFHVKRLFVIDDLSVI